MQLDVKRLSALGEYFDRLVADGKVSGWTGMVSQHGEVKYASAGGMADIAGSAPMKTDSIFRAWSLSKAMTSVAFMTLVEKGLVSLNDPVADYLPSYGDLRVYRAGMAEAPITEGLLEPMRIWHLLTHTSGLGYGSHQSHAVDSLYVAAGYALGVPQGVDLAGATEAWGSFPLRFQPGTAWNYGVSTDVLGRISEIVSGKRLDVHLKESLFEPLGLKDTGFHVDPAQQHRYAEIYAHAEDGEGLNPLGIPADTEVPAFLSGGGGIYTSAEDYITFLGMLVNGGRIAGTSDYVVSPMTVESMRSNHLPGQAVLGSGYGHWPVPAINEVMKSVGFGLGFMTMQAPGESHLLTRAGEFSWLSASSSNFFVDPSTGVAALIVPQLFPSRTLPIMNRLRQFVYQSYR
ncbi:serine hydrolase domain-containing protein [Streptomyces fuscigenes]|uniref:serine hydrolase domain-containing protein n=1 Tax=Streptomyces fuscigenes TaxID=1528880 RepID=UPI001F1E96DF|nr:serine hydrolase domain-containing protein [Streptomyces fuscigenes]MCF3960694.1 beta-lactamase family protein [Streptomyces fuscigenes]